jgi:hypothetical protein
VSYESQSKQLFFHKQLYQEIVVMTKETNKFIEELHIISLEVEERLCTYRQLVPTRSSNGGLQAP